MSVEPCHSCQTPGGALTVGGARPSRRSAEKFCGPSVCCVKCYRRFYERARWATAGRRLKGIRPCGRCGDPEGAGYRPSATRPARYDGAKVGHPGVRICRACRFPPEGHAPASLPIPRPARCRDCDAPATVEAMAVWARGEYCQPCYQARYNAHRREVRARRSAPRPRPARPSRPLREPVERRPVTPDPSPAEIRRLAFEIRRERSGTSGWGCT